jgi:hypothetical protein
MSLDPSELLTLGNLTLHPIDHLASDRVDQLPERRAQARRADRRVAPSCHPSPPSIDPELHPFAQDVPVR